MALSVREQLTLSYVEENEAGETPDTPDMAYLRSTNPNLNPAKASLESEEHWDHRQTQHIRHGFNQVEGSIGFELSMDSLDDMLAAVMSNEWATNVLKVGNLLKTYTFERRFEDIAKYQVFRGVAINQMDLSVQPESIVTGSFNIVGMAFDSPTDSTLGTPTAAPTTPPMDAFTGEVSVGGVGKNVITGVELSVNNNRTVNAVVGRKTSPGVFEGRAQVTGQINTYFENLDEVQAFINEDTFEIRFDLEAPSGNKMTFTIPRAKYMGGSIDPPNSGPLVLNLPFTAEYDDTEETSVKIERVTS